MSLLATLALAASASTVTLPACSWDRPGVNPFMGDVVAAVDRYQDIPAETRARLKARMKQRAYDEIAVITRDAVQGKASYSADIRDMHFGRGSVCRTVTRAKWSAQHQERGLVYCEDGQCLIVPTVCRNLSRITRLAPKPVAGAAQDEEQVVAVAPAEEAPLVFEPPAAGEAAPTSFATTAQVPTLQQSPGIELPPLVTGGGQPPSLPPGLPPTGGVPPLPPTFTPPPDLPPPVPGVTPAVPEPSSYALMGFGLMLIAGLKRRAAQARA